MARKFTNELFFTVEQILNIQKSVLDQLTVEIQHPPKGTPCIGTVMKSMSPFFKMYTEYVNNYDTANDLYMKLKEKKKGFAQFLDKQYANPQCAGLDLPSFLIQPVQRIPRYRLLLQDIVKNTPEDHIDYKNLSFALTTILDVAQLVNDRKKESEAQSMLKELNEKLRGMASIVIQPHRKIVKKALHNVTIYDFTLDGRSKLYKFLQEQFLFTHFFFRLEECNCTKRTLSLLLVYRLASVNAKELLRFRQGTKHLLFPLVVC